MNHKTCDSLTDYSGAAFSDCGTYRYWLYRFWDVNFKAWTDKTDPARMPDTGCRLLAYVGLNPSTADESKDDPTVKRCRIRAANLGYSGMVMLNLFALRSTDPDGLREVAEPDGEGSLNDIAIASWLRLPFVTAVAAWGNYKMAPHRANRLRRYLISSGVVVDWKCLKTNKDDSPAHPLYIPYAQPLISYDRLARG